MDATRDDKYHGFDEVPYWHLRAKLTFQYFNLSPECLISSIFVIKNVVLKCVRSLFNDKTILLSGRFGVNTDVTECLVLLFFQTDFVIRLDFAC